MIMSEAAAAPLSLTAIAARRSAFKPFGALAQAVVEPEVSPDEYARGLHDGQCLAAAAFEPEKEALLGLLSSANALSPKVGPELNLLLRESVIALARQMLTNITIDADFLDTQIAEAVAIITEADDARRICLHPEDAALVGERIHSLSVHSDATVSRGSIRIDCSKGWIEHGVALGLQRLQALSGEPS